MDKKVMIRKSLLILYLALLAAPVGALAQATYEHEPISYNSAPAADAIARLQADLDSAKATLEYDAKHGYLVSVLNRLGIPVSSQTLVFSKTSVQRDQISP